MDQELYEHMEKWWKFQRRHECNLFEALFFDKENVGEEDIMAIVSDVSRFFSLPQPEVNNRCDTFAEVLLGDNADQCELSYNMEMLQKVGINNKDAFTLCFVHEMAHQMLCRHSFMLFCSERWVQELAADLTAGLYAERHSLATGKYKYALSQQRFSVTHPDGGLRREIVECGRHGMERMGAAGVSIMEMVLRYMPAFIYTHYDTLERDWRQMTDELEAPPPPPRQPIDIDKLPDSNLLKQAMMKYRKQGQKQ